MLEVSEKEASSAVILGSRDPFVADTAIKMHHLQAMLDRLEREAEATRSMLMELRETVEQNHRFQTFQQSERRAKETRLDEALRCWKALKARLDPGEGPEIAGGKPVGSVLDTVQRRLAEIEERHLRLEESLAGRRHNVLLVAVVIVVLIGAIGFALV